MMLVTFEEGSLLRHGRVVSFKIYLHFSLDSNVSLQKREAPAGLIVVSLLANVLSSESPVTSGVVRSFGTLIHP